MDYTFNFSRKIKRLYEITETAIVVVEADSLEQAREKAKEFADDDPFEVDWAPADLDDWKELEYEDCLPRRAELIEDADI